MMTVAYVLKSLVNEERHLYLYDTFSGMSKPTSVNVSWKGNPAVKSFQDKKTSDDSADWCRASIDEVKNNIKITGYSPKLIHFIEGKVEDTLLHNIPNKISLLRLDTDFMNQQKLKWIISFQN